MSKNLITNSKIFSLYTLHNNFLLLNLTLKLKSFRFTTGFTKVNLLYYSI